mmetsp:Transcript_16628/g.40918  ORF Transcript_16628/g.40918 Transcript_16628/m.40918 type:complete len:318 (-) Transcript_16628:514-1467(-)
MGASGGDAARRAWTLTKGFAWVGRRPSSSLPPPTPVPSPPPPSPPPPPLGSQRARTGFHWFACVAQSLADTPGPCTFGGGMSSASSARFSLVIPELSTWRSLDRDSCAMLATKNVLPRVRSAQRKWSTDRSSLMAGRRRLGRTSASAEVTAAATADSAAAAAVARRNTCASPASTENPASLFEVIAAVAATLGIASAAAAVGKNLSVMVPLPANPADANTRASAMSAATAVAAHLASLDAASGPATTAAEARSSPSTSDRPSIANSAVAATMGRGGGSASCARKMDPMTSLSAENWSASISASISGECSANSVSAWG